jgi:serine/threonine protein kinase/tetratricopeptide (TPR) repeat protein
VAALSTSLRRFGRYVLFREFATGGMATVHLGRFVGPFRFTRAVAIKRAHSAFARDPQFVASLLDEARMASRVHHPNVVPMLDVVESDGELFLVMEYVHGESLSRLLRASQVLGVRVAPAIAVAVLSDVLNGLHAVHEATGERGEPLGMVHRDVSPQNIIVGADGLARLLDFGIAKAAGRVRTTSDGHARGKMGYMAPEHARGEDVTRASDVYSAAAVLWEMLAARRLFDADDEAALLAHVLAGRVEPPDGSDPTVPATISSLTMRALASNPRDRFATARDFALELERCLPRANATQVGDWVKSLADEALAYRTSLLAELDETGTPPLSRRSGLAAAESIAAGVPLIAGRFAIEQLAGQGGMGSIYRARDVETGALVAIKRLRIGAEPGEAERFTREAMILSALSHPRIVRYVAHGSTPDGARYLAMEWLEGEDLRARVARGTLSVADAFAVAAGAAEALASAHARGLVHRDLKPSNIMLVGGDATNVRIVDFGIARAARGMPPETECDSRTGTPGYMSPEQVRGEDRVDARVDVFALGCLIYECLAGRPAFVATDHRALLAKVLLEDPPRLYDLRPDVGRSLSEFVARMMAKEPEGRPRDGAEALAALRTVRDGAAATAPSPSPRRSITSREQRVVSVVIAAPVARADGPSPASSDLEDPTERDRLRALGERFGARLSRMAGAGFVASFSETGPPNDSAALAARYALELRHLAPGSRFVLATGRGVVSGRLPMGDVIDRAANILRRAPHRAPDIVVDDVSAGLLEGRFEIVDACGSLALRGERATADFARPLLGRVTPFIGRERELAALAGLFDECVVDSVARAVLVIGPSGVGKSRLRVEVLQRLSSRSPRPVVWRASGEAMSAGSPFALLACMVREASGVRRADSIAVARRKIQSRIARCVPGSEVARLSEFLGEASGIPSPDEPSIQLAAARRDPVLFGDQVRRAWEDLLASEAQEAPQILALDDMHWGDMASLRLVYAALRKLHDRPLLVLAFARPEVRETFPGLFEGRELRVEPLAPLTPRASTQLARDVLGEGIEAATVERIVSLSGGNAFYLEELVRAVADGRRDDLPETVLAMAESRLDRFDAEGRRLLRAACVFGQSFCAGGVAALLGTDAAAADVSARLDRLTDLEVIAPRGEPGPRAEREFVFRHPLLREAAYATLTPADRTLGHRLAGDWLERAGETDSLVLAEHFEHGGEPGRAAEWFMRAAEGALAGNDLEGATLRAAQGARCGAAGEMLGALRTIEAEARLWRGENSAALGSSVEAMALLPPGQRFWYRAACVRALTLGKMGCRQELVTLACTLNAIVPAFEAIEGHVRATAHVGVQLTFLGDEEIGERFVRGASSMAGRSSNPRCRAIANQASATVTMLRRRDAHAYLDAMLSAIDEFDAAGDRRGACGARSRAGYAYARLGEYEKAERLLRKALATSRDLGIGAVSATTMAYLGEVLSRANVLDEALSLLREAVEAQQAQRSQRMVGGTKADLAWCLLRLDRLAEAETQAREAVAALPTPSSGRPLALAVLARVLLTGGRPQEALDVSQEGVHMAAEVGPDAEGLSLLRLVHAEALHSCGSRAAARSAIVAARDDVLARAETVRDRHLRSSLLERVWENARILQLAAEWQDSP